LFQVYSGYLLAFKQHCRLAPYTCPMLSFVRHFMLGITSPLYPVFSYMQLVYCKNYIPQCETTSGVAYVMILYIQYYIKTLNVSCLLVLSHSCIMCGYKTWYRDWCSSAHLRPCIATDAGASVLVCTRGHGKSAGVLKCALKTMHGTQARRLYSNICL
jgi:hypothetical protein